MLGFYVSGSIYSSELYFGLVIFMSQVFMLKVSKKGAIYLPKQVVEQLNISEGDRVLMKIEGNRLVLEFIPDPLSLALRIKKWTKTTVREFERESERENKISYTGLEV